MRYKYVTTTLPYINSKAHIGHALEFIQADAITRHLRKAGHDVYFNVGVDEHGSKVYKQAQTLNVDVREYCDQQAEGWMEFCRKLNIGYSNFYRTSSPHHAEQVSHFWNEMLEKGHIYKGSYSGKYCVGCESFKQDKDLINGKCPDHDAVPEELQEENYFFRLSSFKETLLRSIELRPQVIPVFKINELKNQIEEAEDISISRDRKTVPWGVPVPNDEGQTIYVWFEALLNYIFSINPHYPEVKFADSELFTNYWSQSIQLCGPDNLRFQGCIFQAFLVAAGLYQTKQLLVHGTITAEDGTKMSKSKGNVVDPIDQIEKYGVDAVRYYALAGISTHYNSAWNESELVALCNNDLADNYGNLFARTMHLRSRKGFIGYSNYTWPFQEKVREYVDRALKQWDELNISAAIKEIQELLSFGNKYINEREPWKNPDTEVETLDNLYFLLTTATELLSPIIPGITEKATQAIRDNAKVILFDKIEKQQTQITV